MQPKAVEGSRPPLFDRLVDDEPLVRKEAHPMRVYSRAQLLDSIARDLQRLLNSRRASPEPLHPASATLLDYGIPDFSALGAASLTDQRTLAETLRVAIAMFEPRLLDATVHIVADGVRPKTLSGFVSGRLRMDRLMEPISFPVLLHAIDGKVEVLTLSDVNRDNWIDAL